RRRRGAGQRRNRLLAGGRYAGGGAADAGPGDGRLRGGLPPGQLRHGGRLDPAVASAGRAGGPDLRLLPARLDGRLPRRLGPGAGARVRQPPQALLAGRPGAALPRRLRMIAFDEAVAAVEALARPLGAETVRLERADARVLAAPVVARRASPATAVSAMDGYAVRETDLAPGRARLRLAGESFAGAGFDGELAPGTCVRIFTGAPAPRGAERVVVQEEARREGEFVVLEPLPGSGRHL